MANVLGDLFSDIAVAIRKKTGEPDTALMKPAEFVSKIESIKADGGGVDPYYSSAAYSLVTRNAQYISGNSKVLQLRDFKDVNTGSTLGNLQPYSMAGFSNVEAMAFSGFMMLNASNIFVGCSSLKILDFTITNTVGMMIGSGTLNGCTALQSIVFRGNTSFSSININTSHGATSNFYIYVPRANYNNIISNLSNMSGAIKDTSRFRILEDYPTINNWESQYA